MATQLSKYFNKAQNQTWRMSDKFNKSKIKIFNVESLLNKCDPDSHFEQKEWKWIIQNNWYYEH